MAWRVLPVTQVEFTKAHRQIVMPAMPTMTIMVVALGPTVGPAIAQTGGAMPASITTSPHSLWKGNIAMFPVNPAIGMVSIKGYPPVVLIVIETNITDGTEPIVRNAILRVGGEIEIKWRTIWVRRGSHAKEQTWLSYLIGDFIGYYHHNSNCRGRLCTGGIIVQPRAFECPNRGDPGRCRFSRGNRRTM